MKRSVLLPLFLLMGCDSLERVIDGKAAPLREPELPNCSRVLNCCDNLSRSQSVGDTVAPICEGIVSPTDLAISEYQDAKAIIKANNATSQTEKDALLKDLRDTTVAAIEPACRCLIDETIGNISLDGYLAPLDCEVIESTGAIPSGKSCDELTGAITDR